ncbi:MAG: PEP-CTERM sorting domain-containing protein [Phycisphaerae bacterium]|nr:PEP-CTERM sorting domain-containing protein [Phycisphaerae bacterium]
MAARIQHGGYPAAAAFIAGLVTSAHAGIVFDESVSGDLSDDRFAPSALALESGVNSITGTFGISPDPTMPDLDYVTVTVPVGYELDSFVVLAANVGGAFSFVGMELGDIVSIPYDWHSIESPLLGWAHFGSASVGFDLLPELGSAPGAVGFDGPLGAGQYTLWIMELDNSSEYSYSFGLHLTQVPAPGSISLLAIAIALCVRRRRR